MYGDEVRVEYYDGALPESREKFAEVIQEAEARRLVYPLILVNGELKSAGGIDVHQLVFLVDQDRQERGLPTRF